MLGRIADADAGTDRLYAICNDLLTASHDKSESAVAAVESPTAVFYPECTERADKTMENGALVHDCIVRHRPNLPSICRGDDDCGIIFAD